MGCILRRRSENLVISRKLVEAVKIFYFNEGLHQKDSDCYVVAFLHLLACDPCNDIYPENKVPVPVCFSTPWWKVNNVCVGIAVHFL